MDFILSICGCYFHPADHSRISVSLQVIRITDGLNECILCLLCGALSLANFHHHRCSYFDIYQHSQITDGDLEHKSIEEIVIAAV